MDDILIKQEIMSLDDRELVQLFNFTVFTSLGNLGVTEDEFREKLDMSSLSKIQIFNYYNDASKQGNIRNSTIHNSTDLTATDMVVLKNIYDKNCRPLFSKSSNKRKSLVNELKGKYFNGKYDYLTIYKFLKLLFENTNLSCFDIVGLCHSGTDELELKNQQKHVRHLFYEYLKKEPKSSDLILKTLSQTLSNDYRLGNHWYRKKIKLVKKQCFKTLRKKRAISEKNINNLLNNLIDYYLDHSKSSDEFYNIFLNLGIELKNEVEYTKFYIINPNRKVKLSVKKDSASLKSNDLILELVNSYIHSNKTLDEFLMYGVQKMNLTPRELASFKKNNTRVLDLKYYMLINGVDKIQLTKYFQNQGPVKSLDNVKYEYLIFSYLLDYFATTSKNLKSFEKEMRYYVEKPFNLFKKVTENVKVVTTKLPTFEELIGDELYIKFYSTTSREFIAKILETNTISEKQLKNLIITVVGTSSVEENINNIEIPLEKRKTLCIKLVQFFLSRAKENQDINNSFEANETLYICQYLEKFGISKETAYELLKKSIDNYGTLVSSLSSALELEKFMGFGLQVAKPVDLIDMLYEAYTNVVEEAFKKTNSSILQEIYTVSGEAIKKEYLDYYIKNLNFAEIKNILSTISNKILPIKLQQINEMLDEYWDKVQFIYEIDDFCVLNHLKTYQDDSNYNLNSYYTPSIKNAYMLYRFAQFKEKIVPRNHHTEENVFDLSNTSAIDCLNSININMIFKKGSVDSLIENSSVEIIMKNYDAITHNINLEELDYKLKVITIVRNQIAHAHTKNDYNNGIISFEENGIEYEVDVQKLYYLVNEYNKLIHQEKEKAKVA